MRSAVAYCRVRPAPAKLSAFELPSVDGASAVASAEEPGALFPILSMPAREDAIPPSWARSGVGDGDQADEPWALLPRMKFWCDVRLARQPDSHAATC